MTATCSPLPLTSACQADRFKKVRHGDALNSVMLTVWDGLPS